MKCPVCCTDAVFQANHPDTTLYCCNACTHVFSAQKSQSNDEIYSEEYFTDAHQNWFSNPNISLFRWIAQCIPTSAKSLIDVGCGSGQFLKYINKQKQGMHLVGIDIVANENVEGIIFHRSDVLKANLLERFDVVVCQAVIEHVPDLSKFVSQISELCSDDGKVFIMTLNNNSLLYMTARLLNKFYISIAFNQLYSTHHVHHFTTKSLITALARGGLRTVAIRNHNIPLNAIDIPATNLILRKILLVGVSILFFLGWLTNRCYLQTVIAVPLSLSTDDIVSG